METINYLLQDEIFITIAVLLILAVIYLILANNVKRARFSKKKIPAQLVFDDPLIKTEIEIVKKACEKHAITCQYDSERVDKKSAKSAIPLVFYVKTAHGTAYIRNFVTSELINDPEAIDKFLQERVLKAVNEMVNDKVEENKILKMLEQEGLNEKIEGSEMNKKLAGKFFKRMDGEIEILQWFVKNFDEKDMEKVADLLAYATTQSTATINDLHIACNQVKYNLPDYSDLKFTLTDLKRMSNNGINAANAGNQLANELKKKHGSN